MLKKLANAKKTKKKFGHEDVRLRPRAPFFFGNELTR